MSGFGSRQVNGLPRVYLLDAAFESAVLIDLVPPNRLTTTRSESLETILMATRFRRILIITAALAGLGAVVGSVLGVLLMAAILTVTREAWSATVLFVGAAFGAVSGFVLAPIAAWTLMRRVPIWRAVVDTAVGTTIGAGLGLLAQPRFAVVAAYPILLGLLGFTAAALRLRLFYRGDRTGKPTQRVG